LTNDDVGDGMSKDRSALRRICSLSQEEDWSQNADSRIYCRSLTAGRATCNIQEAEGERHLSGSQDAVYYTV